VRQRLDQVDLRLAHEADAALGNGLVIDRILYIVAAGSTRAIDGNLQIEHHRLPCITPGPLEPWERPRGVK
jgi:hypothetical protein